MEAKIKNILRKYQEYLLRYEEHEANLQAKIKFCQEHEFKEEERITRVECEAISMIIYRMRQMHGEIKEALKTATE
jgi:hypothetical protein